MSALGSLVVKLALEYAQYTGGLDKSEQATLASMKKIQGAADQFSGRVVDGFKNAAASIVALFGANALAGHIKAVVDELDRIADAAPAIGLTVQGLSELGFAATMAGSDALSLEGAMGKLNLKVQAAVNGNKEAKQVFSALGVSITDASGKVRATDEILADLSETFRALPEGPTKSALAVELFGKSGAGMVQFLSQGRDGIQALRDEFKALAGGDLERSTEIAGAFNDQLDKLAVKSNSLTMSFGNELLLQLTAVAEEFTSTGDSIWGLEGGMQSVASGAGALLRTFLETLLLVGSDVVFVFAGMGRELGGIAAQAAALATLDWEGVKSIRAEMIADGERAAQKLQEFQDRIANAGQRQAPADNSVEDSRRAVSAQARADAEKRATAALKETDNAAKATEDAYKKLMERVQERIHLADQELSLGRELTEAEKFEAKAKEDLGKIAKSLSASNLAAAQSEIAVVKQKIEQAEIEKQILKELTALSAERQRVRNADYDSVTQWMAQQKQETSQTLKGIHDRLQGLKDEAEAATLAREKNIGLAEAVERVAIARLRERQEWAYEGSERWNELQAEIEAREKLLGLLGKKEVREREEKGWTDMWSSVDQTAHDVFTNVLDGGMSAFKRLGQTLKASVLDLLYQMTVRRWIISIGTSVLGSGFGQAANAATNGTGSSILGMGQNAYSAYNMGSQAYTLGSQYFGGTMSGANALGTMWGNASATGLDGLLATNGAYGTAAGSGAGAGGFAGWGAAGAAAAVIGLAMNALGAFRSEKVVGGGLRGTLGGNDMESYELWRRGGTLFSGPRYYTESPAAELRRYEEEIKNRRDKGEGNYDLAAVYEMEREVQRLKDTYGDQIAAAETQISAIQTAYSAMRTSVGDMADVLGISSDAVRKFTMAIGSDQVNAQTGQMGISFAELSQEQIVAKVEEALRTANNTLAEQVIGTWRTVTEELRSAEIVYGTHDNDSLSNNQQYRERVESVTRVEYVRSEYAREGEKAIDTLTRLATSLSTVNTIFENLGQTLYESSLAGGDMASQLLDLFGGADNFASATGSYFQNFHSQSEQRAAMQRQLQEKLETLDLELPDIDATDARAQWRALVEEQDRTTEAGRRNWAMLVQLNDAFAAITEPGRDVGASIEAILDQQHALWADLAEAQGDHATAAQRRYEIETRGMTEAERAAYDYIAAIRAQVSSAQAAAQALSSLGDSRFDLENQLLELQGKQDEVASRTRARDLEELTKGMSEEDAARVRAAYDYNAALRAQITTQQAAQAAAQQAQQAAQQAAQAAAQLTKAWQSIGDGMVAEIRRIKGLLDGGGSESSLAQAQADFAIATAQARAGDQEAAQQLPALSRALLELAESNATTRLQLQLMQASTGNSLADTAALLASKYGIKLPAFAAGGYYPGGMALVGEEGPEIINFAQPGQVYTASQSRELMSGGGNAAVVEELRGVRRELDGLRKQIQTDNLILKDRAGITSAVLLRSESPDGLKMVDGTKAKVTT